ncbi:MAG: translocation/assembly module TamB domain-containing protein, partial [Duncaniella sp.]|nr:translocation/assembly module TamB domain-containing protein [Duncaniella sp.]
IDQYDKTVEGNTSTATSYSYRVSKSLFNDRVKIIVGGNYSTDANADQNLSQNLINDISIEYLLNRTGSMYVRIFRHTGYESILEGEVTQTGVGFVFKRRLNSLRDLFARKARTVLPASTLSTAPDK